MFENGEQNKPTGFNHVSYRTEIRWRFRVLFKTFAYTIEYNINSILYNIFYAYTWGIRLFIIWNVIMRRLAVITYFVLVLFEQPRIDTKSTIKCNITKYVLLFYYSLTLVNINKFTWRSIKIFFTIKINDTMQCRYKRIHQVLSNDLSNLLVYCDTSKIHNICSMYTLQAYQWHCASMVNKIS